jgi:hypothetical protein
MKEPIYKILKRGHMRNAVDEFQAQLENLIGRYSGFHGMDLASAIGVLEVVKHNLIEQHKQGIDDATHN